MSNEPLLSICIPTFNRAPYLEKTLRSIVEQSVFLQSNNVEIVISDNCSTDTTESVVQDFSLRFPGKVRFVKTAQQIPSAHNFAHVLQYARGKLCKLHNDTAVLRPESLVECLDVLQKCYHTEPRPFFYFFNDNTKSREKQTLCTTIDAFIAHISFYITWIGGFSLWQDDIPYYTQFFSQTQHHFPHTEILLSALIHGRTIEVYNIRLQDVQEASKPVTVEFLNTVYLNEYLKVIEECVLKGNFSQKAYRHEVLLFLFYYYLPYYCRLKKFSIQYHTDFVFIPRHTTRAIYVFVLLAYPFYVLGHAYLQWPVFYTIAQKSVGIIRKIAYK